jgi:broad specificity phosphatase PhoE
VTARLTLICHAATPATRAAAFPVDEPLEPQATERLAALRHDLGQPDRCWTSPAVRAIQTARALGFCAATEPDLRDCDYGRWRGLSFDDVHAREPEAIAAWMREPAAAPHGGESRLHLIERAAGWLDAQSGVPGRTFAVTHASVIRAAVVHAIGATPQSFWRIDVAPLSVVRLSGLQGRWNLVSIGPMPTQPDQPRGE